MQSYQLERSVQHELCQIDTNDVYLFNFEKVWDEMDGTRLENDFLKETCCKIVSLSQGAAIHRHLV